MCNILNVSGVKLSVIIYCVFGRFREDNKRVVYLKAMSVFLPLMHQQANQLLTDMSTASLQLQRIILKIFYALIEVQCQYLWYAVFYHCMQYHLPLSLLNENTIPGWMQILHSIIDRNEPKVSLSCDPLVINGCQNSGCYQECTEIQDEEERAKHEFWKSKKWALSIIVRIFERY